jgi:hypothetical protein
MSEINDIHVHVHIHNEPDPRMDTVLKVLHSQNQQLYQLIRQERKVSMDLSELTAQVSTNTDVVESAVLLISGLADQLEAAAGDPAAVQDLVNQLRSNNDVLAAAVAAGTPAAPPPADQQPPADGQPTG